MSQDEKKGEGCKGRAANKGLARHFEQTEGSSALKSKHTQESWRWRPGSVLSKHCSLRVLSFTVFQLSLSKWVDQLSRAWVGPSYSIPELAIVRC